ncbi:unnamed protein product, partial [Ectocarpus sp. 13 AM-2016]
GVPHTAPPLPPLPSMQPPFPPAASSNVDEQGQYFHEQGWAAAGGYPAPHLPPPPGQPPAPGPGPGSMGSQMGSQMNSGQVADQMGHYMGGQLGGHMGGMGGPMAPMSEMGGGQQQQQQQQHALEAYQGSPVGNALHPAAMASPMAGMGGGIGHGNMGGSDGMNGSMMGGMQGGMGGGGGGGAFLAGPAAVPQRPAKKVPDWLVQTLKEKEKLAEKQKKKEGASLSTDVAAALSSGAGNISGYNLVHSPSPSPPDSPSARRTKPSWQEDDSDDDSADETSPKRENRDKRASNGSAVDGSAGASTRNGSAKPSGILKKGGNKQRGAGGGLDRNGDDATAEADTAPLVMDDETRASFDREIRRLLTHLLKVGTANIIREVASSALEEAQDSAAAAAAAASPQAQQQQQQQQQPRVRQKEQREQKKAVGALIGGYESESPSESEGDASPPPPAAAPAPATTVSADARAAAAPPPAVEKRAHVKVGGKWPLPSWADPPHEAPLPEGLSIVVETIGPDLERVKTQELSFSTTVMGRFEEQCGFVVEDASASRCHAAILASGKDVFVVDIFSANGTAVNGKKIQPGVLHALSAGGVLTLGTRNQSFRVIVRSTPPPRREDPRSPIASANAASPSFGGGSAQPPKVADSPPKFKQDLVALAATIAARINTKSTAATATVSPEAEKATEKKNKGAEEEKRKEKATDATNRARR